MGNQNTIDGIGIYEIDILKARHPGHRLLYMNIIGIEFVFRTISFDEFEHMSRVCYDEKELFETACQLTVLYPEGYDFIKGMAGISEQLGPKIIEVSGFGENGADVVLSAYESYRSLMKTSKYAAMTTIKAAMAEVSIEEMELWPWDRMLKYLAIAEATLKIMGIDLSMIQEESNPIMEEAGFDENIGYHLQGIDPIQMFGTQIKEVPFVEFPLIGSRHWNREDVVYEIKRQMDRGPKLRP